MTGTARKAPAPKGIPVGSQAPDFALKDNHGRTVRLFDLRGGQGADGGVVGGPDGGVDGAQDSDGDGRNVVLVFYPFAFTGVCTGELHALRDQLPSFVNDDTQLLAVSTDSIHTLRIFAEQEDLEFPLLSDFWPHGETSRAYGIFDEEKGCALRGTFVIDKRGVVRWSVVNGLPDARDLDEYVKALAAL
ncbi:Putative peroxiredoxin [Streptomyces sp. S4.7]|uniref:peroxiredoxin n=1 Tax=Streptomyces sp. S4.7 TaxID=2705439 RepID=UPI001398A6A7|nr:peroxiredoxin [Streptomyces sp. S4.7]QHY95306.1 Putative peroxiredoxin [Streptomyces sp. S4.7]